MGHRQNYTEEEEIMLMEFVDTANNKAAGYEEAAKHLNRTVKAIAQKYNRLKSGRQSGTPYKRWTEEEKKLVVTMHKSGYGNDVIADALYNNHKRLLKPSSVYQRILDFLEEAGERVPVPKNNIQVEQDVETISRLRSQISDLTKELEKVNKKLNKPAKTTKPGEPVTLEITPNEGKTINITIYI